MTTVGENLRKPGRPRSAQAHQAILRATLELLAQEGYTGMSLEGVAARAGVGKTTIYRRWDSKEELVMDAIRSIHAQAPVIDTGNFRDDILTILKGAAQINSPLLQGLLFRVLGEMQTNPQIIQVFIEHLAVPRFQRLMHMVERAKARGEIRPDVDAHLVVSLLAGPFFYYVLFGGIEVAAPPLPNLPEQIVDNVLRGIGKQ